MHAVISSQHWTQIWIQLQILSLTQLSLAIFFKKQIYIFQDQMGSIGGYAPEMSNEEFSNR